MKYTTIHHSGGRCDGCNGSCVTHCESCVGSCSGTCGGSCIGTCAGACIKECISHCSKKSFIEDTLVVKTKVDITKLNHFIFAKNDVNNKKEELQLPKTAKELGYINAIDDNYILKSKYNDNRYYVNLSFIKKYLDARKLNIPRSMGYLSRFGFTDPEIDIIYDISRYEWEPLITIDDKLIEFYYIFNNKINLANHQFNLITPVTEETDESKSQLFSDDYIVPSTENTNIEISKPDEEKIEVDNRSVTINNITNNTYNINVKNSVLGKIIDFIIELIRHDLNNE